MTAEQLHALGEPPSSIDWLLAHPDEIVVLPAPPRGWPITTDEE